MLDRMGISLFDKGSGKGLTDLRAVCRRLLVHRSRLLQLL